MINAGTSNINMRQSSGPLGPCRNWKAVVFYGGGGRKGDRKESEEHDRGGWRVKGKTWGKVLMGRWKRGWNQV